MSLTYDYKGFKALIDGGFHGYTEDAYRAYFRTPRAHNVAILSNPEKFRWDAETTLSRTNFDSNKQIYGFSDIPYAGVIRERWVANFFSPAILFCVDTLSMRDIKSVDQIWHFSEDLDIYSSKKDAERSGTLNFG